MPINLCFCFAKGKSDDSGTDFRIRIRASHYSDAQVLWGNGGPSETHETSSERPGKKSDYQRPAISIEMLHLRPIIWSLALSRSQVIS
jgi:hypothetical protein